MVDSKEGSIRPKISPRELKTSSRDGPMANRQLRVKKYGLNMLGMLANEDRSLSRNADF